MTKIYLSYSADHLKSWFVTSDSPTLPKQFNLHAKIGCYVTSLNQGLSPSEEGASRKEPGNEVGSVLAFYANICSIVAKTLFRRYRTNFGLTKIRPCRPSVYMNHRKGRIRDPQTGQIRHQLFIGCDFVRLGGLKFYNKRANSACWKTAFGSVLHKY